MGEIVVAGAPLGLGAAKALRAAGCSIAINSAYHDADAAAL